MATSYNYISHGEIGCGAETGYEVCPVHIDYLEEITIAVIDRRLMQHRPIYRNNYNVHNEGNFKQQMVPSKKFRCFVLAS